MLHRRLRSLLTTLALALLAALMLAAAPSLAASPQANDDFAATKAGVPVTVHVLANDSGADGGVHECGPPSNGSATINDDEAACVYTPGEGFTGYDSFSYNFGSN